MMLAVHEQLVNGQSQEIVINVDLKKRFLICLVELQMQESSHDLSYAQFTDEKVPVLQFRTRMQ